jgi:hypothetical protein
MLGELAQLRLPASARPSPFRGNPPPRQVACPSSSCPCVQIPNRLALAYSYFASLFTSRPEERLAEIALFSCDTLVEVAPPSYRFQRLISSEQRGLLNGEPPNREGASPARGHHQRFAGQRSGLPLAISRRSAKIKGCPESRTRAVGQPRGDILPRVPPISPPTHGVFSPGGTLAVSLLRGPEAITRLLEAAPEPIGGATRSARYRGLRQFAS